MASAPQPDDTAKIRILRAAESLFARNSIEAVSFREIAQKAGHRNVNAVQYHFGDLSSLMQAIFVWRVSQMEQPRGEILKALESEGRVLGLRDLLRALCEPILELVDEDGMHTYAGFMCQYLLYHRPMGMVHASDVAPEIASNLRKIQQKIFQLLRTTKPEHFDQRVALAYLIVMNSIVFSDTAGLNERDPSQFRENFEAALDMASEALAARIASASSENDEAAFPEPE